VLRRGLGREFVHVQVLHLSDDFFESGSSAPGWEKTDADQGGA
jgi:hypothetical protein